MSNEENKNFWNTRKWIILLLIIGVGSYAAGAHSSALSAKSSGVDSADSKKIVSVAGVGEAAPKGIADSIEFQQFWDLWQMLKSKYYKQPLDEQKMLYGAMSGMTASFSAVEVLNHRPGNG